MMNSFSTLLINSGGVHPGVLWFADLYIKSVVILAIVFCLQLPYRHRSASDRSSLWKLTFVVLMLLPVLKLLFPNLIFSLALDQAIYTSVLESELAFLGTLVPYLTDRNVSLLGTVYLAAVGLLSAYLICGLLRTYLICRTATPMPKGALHDYVQNLKEVNGSQQHVELLQSSAVGSPLTWGMLNNRIIFPASGRHWDDSVLHQILRHEFGHILRRDWSWQILARLTCYLFWLNPLVWIAHKALILECEKASDDFVTEEAGDSIPYAETMLWIARTLTGRQPIPAVAVLGGRSQLRTRIAHILDNKRCHEINRNSLLPAILMSVLLCFSVSPLQFSVKEREVNGSVATPSLLYEVKFFQKGSAEFAVIMREKSRYAAVNNQLR